MHGFLRLTESVDINDCDEVVKLVISGKIDCLPNASFCNLTVSTDTKYGVVDFVEVLA
jgi:hypothetical protein